MEHKPQVAWTPWSVYCAPLRHGMHKVIEIHDASGMIVVAWSGFDGTDFSFTNNLRHARRIVKAVNALNPERDDG